MRSNTRAIAMSEKPPPAAGPTKTRSLSRSRGSARNSAITAGASGTQCSLPAFMRAAGTVQSALSRSISGQRAPNTSPVRAAVNIVNSSARAALLWRARSSVMKLGSST